MIKSLNMILNGLSAQYADEYLSASDKDKILNNRPLRNEARIKTSHRANIVHPEQFNDNKRRIALLCNDTTNQNVINYVLSNANNCSVDILYHGVHKIIPKESFYKHARSTFFENNVEVSIVKLINDSIDDVKDYLLMHRKLQYLVTDSHDELISSFLNNKSITNKLQIPIVLIN